MALSRTLVRLCNEVAEIVSRPRSERDVEPLYQLGTTETLLRYLTEDHGPVSTCHPAPVVQGHQ